MKRPTALSPTNSATPGAYCATAPRPPWILSPMASAFSITSCTLPALPETQTPPLTTFEPTFSSPPSILRTFGLAMACSSTPSGPLAPPFSSIFIGPLVRTFATVPRPFILERALNAPGPTASSAPPAALLRPSVRLPPWAIVLTPLVSALMPILASGPSLSIGTTAVSAPAPAERRTPFQSLPSEMAVMAPTAPPIRPFTSGPPGMKLAASERPVTSSWPAGLWRKPPTALPADLMPPHALAPNSFVLFHSLPRPPPLTKSNPFLARNPSGVYSAALPRKEMPFLRPAPSAPTMPVRLAQSSPPLTFSPIHEPAPLACWATQPAAPLALSATQLEAPAAPLLIAFQAPPAFCPTQPAAPETLSPIHEPTLPSMPQPLCAAAETVLPIAAALSCTQWLAFWYAETPLLASAEAPSQARWAKFDAPCATRLARSQALWAMFEPRA